MRKTPVRSWPGSAWRACGFRWPPPLSAVLAGAAPLAAVPAADLHHCPHRWRHRRAPLLRSPPSSRSVSPRHRSSLPSPTLPPSAAPTSSATIPFHHRRAISLSPSTTVVMKRPTSIMGLKCALLLFPGVW